MSLTMLFFLSAGFGADSETSFIGLSRDGEERRLNLQRVDSKATVDWGGKSVAVADLIEIRQSGVLRPAWPREPHLVFSNGDRLAGRCLECDGRTVQFQPTMPRDRIHKKDLIPVWKIPVSRLESIRFRTDSKPTAATPGKADRLILQNGDSLEGNLSKIDSNGSLVFELRDLKKTISLDEISQLIFNSELRSNRKPEKPYWRAIFCDGSRLALENFEIRDGKLHGMTFYKVAAVIPANEVVAIVGVGGNVVDLSELEAKEYRYTSFLDESLPWYRNRAWDGSQLCLESRLGTHFFDRGIAQRSRSELAFALEGKYRAFRVELGLDPEHGRRGDTDVSVLIDGKSDPKREIRSFTLPKGIDVFHVNVEGAKELRLRVDWGANGPIEDIVNWAEPRLILK